MTYELNLKEVNQWKDYCLSHEITVEEIIRISKGKAPLIGDRCGHVLILPIGFRFVFSIEYVPSLISSDIHKMRRLSGSSTRLGKYPSPELMKTIAQILGFSPFEKCIIRLNKNAPIPNVEVDEIIGIVTK
jgi:hypothetical protein